MSQTSQAMLTIFQSVKSSSEDKMAKLICYLFGHNFRLSGGMVKFEPDSKFSNCHWKHSTEFYTCKRCKHTETAFLTRFERKPS